MSNMDKEFCYFCSSSFDLCKKDCIPCQAGVSCFCVPHIWYIGRITFCISYPNFNHSRVGQLFSMLVLIVHHNKNLTKCLQRIWNILFSLKCRWNSLLQLVSIIKSPKCLSLKKMKVYHIILFFPLLWNIVKFLLILPFCFGMQLNQKCYTYLPLFTTSPKPDRCQNSHDGYTCHKKNAPTSN